MKVLKGFSILTIDGQFIGECEIPESTVSKLTAEQIERFERIGAIEKKKAKKEEPKTEEEPKTAKSKK